MVNNDVQAYKNYIAQQLGKLSPILQQYAIGDFSSSIPVPQEENEFSELLVTLNLMADNIQKII